MTDDQIIYNIYALYSMGTLSEQIGNWKCWFHNLDHEYDTLNYWLCVMIISITVSKCNV